jgi:hypothetical protein
LQVVVFADDIAHGRLELVDVPVGVNVAGRGDRRVFEQLLDGLQVAGAVEHRLAGGVPRHRTG